MTHEEEKNFMVQKNKYRSRAEKFLIAGALGVVATVGLIAAAPAMATVPVLATALAMNGTSLAGFAANKIAENTTDSFEPQSKREKVMGAIASLRENAFGGKKNTNRFEI